MKKLTQIVSAILLSVAFVGVSNTVSAIEGEGECSGAFVITNTGPESENIITCIDVENLIVTCQNNIYVLNDNDQFAHTGNSQGEGNTITGNAFTGDASNENRTIVEIGAECDVEGEEKEGEKGEKEEEKAPVVVTGAEVPSAGAGAAAPQKVAALPFTAGNSTLETAAISAIVLATAFATIRLAVAAYRRQALKQ